MGLFDLTCDFVSRHLSSSAKVSLWSNFTITMLAVCMWVGVKCCGFTAFLMILWKFIQRATTLVIVVQEEILWSCRDSSSWALLALHLTFRTSRSSSASSVLQAILGSSGSQRIRGPLNHISFLTSSLAVHPLDARSAGFCSVGIWCHWWGSLWFLIVWTRFAT